jgi:membrane protease YdiL (CAAX protease family)
VNVKVPLAAGLSLAAGSGLMATILLAGPPLVAPLAPTLLGPSASDAAQEALLVLVLFGAMIAVALIGGILLQCRIAALGAYPMRAATIGGAVGLLGIAIATGYAGIAGTLRGGGGTGGMVSLLLGAALVLFQAGAEELYFRGWIQPALARAWGVVPAILVTATVFAGLHFLGAGANAPLAFVNFLLGGTLFGVLAERGGLAGAIAAHFAWNGTEQLVLGLDPNPGLGSFGSLLDLELAGPAGWGGSAEGLNASLAMAMALMVVLVPLMILARAARSPRS